VLHPARAEQAHTKDFEACPEPSRRGVWQCQVVAVARLPTLAHRIVDGIQCNFTHRRWAASRAKGNGMRWYHPRLSPSWCVCGARRDQGLRSWQGEVEHIRAREIGGSLILWRGWKITCDTSWLLSSASSR